MSVSFLQPFDHCVNDFRTLIIYSFYSGVFTLSTVAHHEEKSHFHGASFRHRQK
jgi:hypothetical protein